MVFAFSGKKGYDKLNRKLWRRESQKFVESGKHNEKNINYK